MKKSLTVFVCWFTLFVAAMSGSDVYSASKYEVEPNENKGSATQVEFGEAVTGKMWHALDYDWYAVTASSAGVVNISAYYKFPDGGTADTGVLLVELRDASNKVLSDFLVDYKELDSTYSQNIDIPSPDTYYIVVHCPSKAKFKRDGYELTISEGAGKNNSGSLIDKVKDISLSLSQNSVKSDNSDSSEITATLIGEDRVPIKGVKVMFEINPELSLNSNVGQLSNALVVTDEKGKAVVSFSSGSFERGNQIVIIKASVANKDPELSTIIPIKISGSSLTLDPGKYTSLEIGGNDTTILTVTAKDAGGFPIPNADITVSQANSSTQSGIVNFLLLASLESFESDTDVSADITVTALGTEQHILVPFKSPGSSIGTITLSPGPQSKEADGSRSALIMATIKDAQGYYPPKDTKVEFKTTAGKLSKTSDTADSSGNIELTLTYSASPTTATVTATVSDEKNPLYGTTQKILLPFQDDASTITLTADPTSIKADGLSSTSIIANIKKSQDTPAPYGTTVDFSTNYGKFPDDKQTLSLKTQVFKTDVYGEVKIPIQAISGNGDNNVNVKVEGIGDTKIQQYSVYNNGNALRITSTSIGSKQNSTTEYKNVDLTIGEELTIVVTVPKEGTAVSFFSTLSDSKFGKLRTDVNKDLLTYDKTTKNNQPITAYFKAAKAGIASIYAVDLKSENFNQNDSMTATIAASAIDAKQISLQASPTIVAPSSSNVDNASDLIATVKNADGQPVKDAMVIFSIDTPLGGGERIVPGWAITDSSGMAYSKFIAGSLPSGGVGPNADGIKLRAHVANSGLIPDANAKIVIGGTPGSVVIGRSTAISVAGDDTQYILPMSILVSDAGGHPVANKKVSLNTWPARYGKGKWIVSGENWITDPTWYENEDINRNNILDGGETDTDNDGITPKNSSAGNLPQTVTTDENGVANFNLVYLKHYAGWIEAEFRASVIVSGTETISEIVFKLPAALEDTKPELLLPLESPFGSGE